MNLIHAILATVPLGALGYGILAFIRHLPAPTANIPPTTPQIWYAWVFDSVQDLAKNNDRIGERQVLPPASSSNPS